MGPIPVKEYLSSVYEPDMDFVEGELEDRNVGEKDHSKVQLRVVRLLENGKWFVAIGARVRISPTRYRVPDICVYEREPEEQVLHSPPWIVVEILSREDRMSLMQRKMEDYYTAGCPHIWILDPWLRKAYEFDGTSIAEVSELVTEDGRVRLKLAELFSAVGN